MKKSILNLEKQIEKLENRIEKIQLKCKHVNKTSENKGNTGNLDFNVYWIENTCLDCGKFWRSDEKTVPSY